MHNVLKERISVAKGANCLLETMLPVKLIVYFSIYPISNFYTLSSGRMKTIIINRDFWIASLCIDDQSLLEELCSSLLYTSVNSY